MPLTSPTLTTLVARHDDLMRRYSPISTGSHERDVQRSLDILEAGAAVRDEYRRLKATQVTK